MDLKGKIMEKKWWSKVLVFMDQNNEPYVRCQKCNNFSSWGIPRPEQCIYCSYSRFVERFL